MCTGTNCGKVVLYGLSTGTKSEKLNIYSSNNTIYLRVAFIPTLFSLKIRKKGRKKATIVSNILNSLLVPVLNPKSTTFSHLVPVQNSKKKIQKSFFFGYLSRSKYLIFGLKKFLKNFEAAFGT